MDRSERFRKIDRLLRSRFPVSMTRLIEELEVSKSTVKRDLEYLRDRLNAPIAWDGSRRGYHYDEQEESGQKFALPGLWLNQSELSALLGMESLLANIQPGLLAPHLAPLKKRISQLLQSGGYAAAKIAGKVKILHCAARPVPSQHFPLIMTALLEGKRLRINHYKRAANRQIVREISPQRLLYYRDNWYLDAFCHLRDDLRCFALDAVSESYLLPEESQKVDPDRLDRFFATAYGIFAGDRTKDAVLRFSPQSARWVASEEWHPRQQGQTDPDGAYILSFPYENDTELIMDILRYGPEVEVLVPVELRQKVKERLEESLKKYSPK